MTIWYRAHNADNISEVFSGDSGLFAANRWNYMGDKAVYCSDSIALCTLEWLTNAGLSLSGFSYYRYSINVPDNLIVKFDLSALPVNWNIAPAHDFTRDFANEYLFSSTKYLALAVPSAIVPEEYNLVINPLHPSFQAVFKTIKSLGKYIAPVRADKGH